MIVFFKRIGSGLHGECVKCVRGARASIGVALDNLARRIGFQWAYAACSRGRNLRGPLQAQICHPLGGGTYMIVNTSIFQSGLLQRTVRAETGH
jgi:hypothetical protein